MGGLGNRKYAPGSLVGPNKIELVERTKRVGSSYYAKFRCPYDGNIFETTINAVVQGQTKSCGCLWEKTKKNAKNLGSEDLTGRKYGHLTVLEKTNKRNNSGCIVWKCQCDCKNKTIAFVDTKSLKSGHTQSCGCKKSKGETKIANVLNGLNISYIQQYAYKGCSNKKTLRFDFYLPDYNCCIEYDGIQHFYPIERFGGKKEYEDTKRRDEIKNSFCKENNIRLIRIPYTDYNKINHNYILSCLNSDEKGL